MLTPGLISAVVGAAQRLNVRSRTVASRSVAGLFGVEGGAVSAVGVSEVQAEMVRTAPAPKKSPSASRRPISLMGQCRFTRPTGATRKG